MKPYWEITPEEADACLQATTWHASDLGYFRGGGWSTRFRTRGGMPVTMCRVNLVQGLGPALQIAEGWTVELPDPVHETLDERTNPTWPTTWFVPRTTGSGPFRDVYTVMNNWGANHGAIGYGHFGADYGQPVRHAAHSRLHAQPGRGGHLPPQCVDALRRQRADGRRLPRVCELWAAVRVNEGRVARGDAPTG
jgi:L-fucose isomerase-like protein